MKVPLQQNPPGEKVLSDVLILWDVVCVLYTQPTTPILPALWSDPDGLGRQTMVRAWLPCHRGR
jgi:hypothetical protein